MALWVAWLIIAVVLGVAEAFTLTAALGILGAAALLTAGVAGIGLSAAVQLLVFALAASAGVVLLRPVAARHLARPRLERFGVDALAGRTGYVVQEVTARSGLVHVAGEEWTARPLDAAAVIPAGAAVQVMQIDGATAIVFPEE
jgi:membrane protein implicated in regulation of membrane protease activity